MIEKRNSPQIITTFSNFIENYSLPVLYLAFFLYSIIYVASRSFWLDESMVALSIVESGISPFEPLKVHNQVSPWGFVLITKLVILLFGAGDLQFRLPGTMMYFGSMGYLACYFKRRYGLTVALVFSFIILANPVLLRYSTEFKHYVYEFSFAIILLTSYFEILNNNQHAKYIYGISALLSIFFGISIIFVIAAIFGVEMLRRLKLSYKKTFQAKWFLFHGLVFAGFLIWYIVSITPNIYFNLINYPHYFNFTLGPENILNVNYWGKLLNILNSVLIENLSIILIICFLSCLFLFFAKIISQLNFSIISLPFIIYLLIYFLNFAGKYPILAVRHSLFVLPAIYHLFAYLTFKLQAAIKIKVFQFILCALLIGISAGTLLDHHTQGKIFVQEIKPVLNSIHPTDKVFLYFSAQPGYQWYKLTLYQDLPIPLNPEVNAETGLGIPVEEMQSNLPELITKHGAWPAIARLTSIDDTEIYAKYLTDQISQVKQSKVIVSHRKGLDLQRNLAKKCDFTVIERNISAYILSVNCP